MPRILEVFVFCFAQFVALMGILIGSTYVRQLTDTLSAALGGRPWQGSDLARLVACSCGPILVGVFISVGMIWFVIDSSRLRRRKAAFPDQPWLWRPDWETRLVRLSNKAAIVFFAIAMTAYLLIFLPLGIYLASQKGAVMVYGFLAVLAMFLLLMIWLQWINRFRNHSVLRLDTLPGRINGDFSGLATIPLSFPAGTTFHVRLRCELTLVSRGGRRTKHDAISLLTDSQNSSPSSRSHTSTIYDDTKLVTPEGSHVTPNSTSIPVTFTIPAELPSTGMISGAAGSGSSSSATRHYFWSIRIRLSTETDLREIVFEIPVFDMSGRHVIELDDAAEGLEASERPSSSR